MNDRSHPERERSFTIVLGATIGRAVAAGTTIALPPSMTTNTTDALAILVRTYGFRVTNLDAKRAGISERVLASAVARGAAKVERASFCGTSPDGAVVVTYLVFA